MWRPSRRGGPRGGEREEQVAREAGRGAAGRVGLHSPCLPGGDIPARLAASTGAETLIRGRPRLRPGRRNPCSCPLCPRARGSISGVCFLGDPPPTPPPPPGYSGERSLSDPVESVLGLVAESGERFKIFPHRQKVGLFLWGLAIYILEDG